MGVVIETRLTSGWGSPRLSEQIIGLGWEKATHDNAWEEDARTRDAEVKASPIRKPESAALAS